MLCFFSKVMTLVSKCVGLLALFLALYPGSGLLCPDGCTCSDCDPQVGLPGNMSLTCSFDNISQVNLMINPGQVCSLNLARRGIKVLTQQSGWLNFKQLRNLYLDNNIISWIEDKAFQGLGNLTKLSLDHNKLVSLTSAMFNGLFSLQYLNLAYNSLKQWNGVLNEPLPRLTYLNVEGNLELILSETLLADTTLQTIEGGSISTACKNCNFSRANVSREKLLPRRKCQYIPDEHLSFVDEHQAKFILFKGQCAGKKCELSLTDIDPVRKIYKDMCWAQVRDIRATEIVLGALVVVLNLLVIIGTLFSKLLRSKVSFMLIAHLAFCDLLLGVYSIAVSTGHAIDHDPSFRGWRVSHCPYYRTVFLLGQTMGVFTSLLLTVERQLAIVHFSRRSKMISHKVAAALLAICWVLTGVMCFCIDYFDNAIIRDNFMCILIQNFETAKRLLYTQGLILFLVLLYLIIFALYIHMCVFVKRSSAASHVKGETSLAKRIGLIVFTNSVFFVIPNIMIVAFSAGMLNVSTKPVADAMVRIWLPPMCMVFNALLNPILFALWNTQFTTELKKSLCCKGNEGGEGVAMTRFSHMEADCLELS